MAAAAAACKRVVQLAVNSGLNFAKNRGFVHLYSTHHYRHISQLVQSDGKSALLVDTLTMVRQLEAQGIPSKQAEELAKVLNDSLKNVTHSFVSKSEMQKSEMVRDLNLSKFKSEEQSSQEHHFSMLQRETEKLRSHIEKMSSELRYEIRAQLEEIRAQLEARKYEIDKLSNTFTAQMEARKYEIDKLSHTFTAQLEAVSHTSRAQLDTAKSDVIKYCMGTLVSISTIGLVLARIWM
ncbi:DUF1640 domain-containing protein [Cephalotus follicularis]|uniref:DUF1640 domain-containing protein n=1 Tax=Cephalotus follicularis TaxID=3775 RepID=A0A1Q3CVR8_CEPFO|nr:DUF1640 domain-containing protein [Cephalotus follicularis]